MSLESLGLKLLPYPPYPSVHTGANLSTELAAKHAQTLFEQERQYHTIRHTNYLNFLFVYNARINQRTSDLRSLGLALTKTIPALENESIFSVVSTVKRAHIYILQSTFSTLLTLIRLIHRVHELLYCYQFTLISMNEYYNSTKGDMNTVFKSIIQLNYEASIKQQLTRGLHHPPHSNDYGNDYCPSPRHNSHLPAKHFHDDLAFENPDLTQLLICHTQDLLAQKLPKMSQTELFIHLKTKTLQVNKMLMAECLPLFLSFNQTMSFLLQNTLKTVESLFKQTIVETTLSFSFKIQFSCPLYHTHNTVQFKRFRAQQQQQVKVQQALKHLDWIRQQQSHDGIQDNDGAQAREQEARVKQLQNTEKLFNVQDEAEFLNKPFAYGVVVDFLMFKIGPCCLRHAGDDTSIDTIPLPKIQSIAQEKCYEHSGAQSNQCMNENSDIEMGQISTTSIPSKSIKLPPVSTPATKLIQNTSHPNPYYDRSQRISLQKQNVYQLISYLRQVKFIFQEIIYQRFYGGRDGFYSPYPAQLANLEHSFLVTIEQCPPAFIDIISQLGRLDGDL